MLTYLPPFLLLMRLLRHLRMSLPHELTLRIASAIELCDYIREDNRESCNLVLNQIMRYRPKKRDKPGKGLSSDGNLYLLANLFIAQLMLRPERCGVFL